MISLVPDDEQAGFTTAIRDFLSRRLPLSRVRELAAEPNGIDDGLWQEMSDLGWLAVSTPEELGGVGLSVVEEALLMVEAGRFLVPGPLRSTLLAARIARDAGRPDLVEHLISGERRAGIAVDDMAVDARLGDLLVVTTDDSTQLVELLEGEVTSPVDPNTRVRRITRTNGVLEVARSYRAYGRLLAAAELLGVLEGVRDESAAYARLREQFGKPIGSFQAVKHRCADMAIAAYAVRAQVTFAAVHLDALAPDAEFQVDSAYALASELTRDSSKANILNHGGFGFTWEADPHLRLKRAVLLGRLHGSAREVSTDILSATPNA